VEQQQQGCQQHMPPGLQAVSRGWGWTTRTPGLALQQHLGPAHQAAALTACRRIMQHNQQDKPAYSSSSSKWQPWRAYCSSSACSSSSDSSSSCHGYVLDYVHKQPCPSLQQASQPAAAAAAAAPTPTAAAVAHGLHAAAAAHDPSKHPRGRVVAVAVSGGVDSAVSALLLQQQGYQLFGVYMHNWDAADEAGAGTPTCTSEADLADAQELCRTLGIPLYQADFVSRWGHITAQHSTAQHRTAWGRWD
jgi:hypothetical protein